MPITQRSPIGSDIQPAVVQQNLSQLFENAHVHDVRTTAPTDKDGAVNDVIPVLLGSTAYLYIKFPTVGWKRILLT